VCGNGVVTMHVATTHVDVVRVATTCVKAVRVAMMRVEAVHMVTTHVKAVGVVVPVLRRHVCRCGTLRYPGRGAVGPAN
jgi:hypothetical protein